MKTLLLLIAAPLFVAFNIHAMENDRMEIDTTATKAQQVQNISSLDDLMILIGINVMKNNLMEIDTTTIGKQQMEIAQDESSDNDLMILAEASLVKEAVDALEEKMYNQEILDQQARVRRDIQEAQRNSYKLMLDYLKNLNLFYQAVNANAIDGIDLDALRDDIIADFTELKDLTVDPKFHKLAMELNKRRVQELTNKCLRCIGFLQAFNTFKADAEQPYSGVGVLAQCRTVMNIFDRDIAPLRQLSEQWKLTMKNNIRSIWFNCTGRVQLSQN